MDDIESLKKENQKLSEKNLLYSFLSVFLAIALVVGFIAVQIGARKNEKEIETLQFKLDEVNYDAYNEGYEDGIEYGRSDGYYDGESYGRKEGYNEGYSNGYEDGEGYGYSTGYDEGYDEGYTKGYEDGLYDGSTAG